MIDLTIPKIFADASSHGDLAQTCSDCAFKSMVYIFCITPRVGSTALMNVLEEAGFCKRIEEILNPRGVVDKYAREFSLTTFRDYIQLISNSTKDRFAFKTSWNDFSFLAENRHFATLFPRRKFVFLDRTDIDAQAVSLYMAKQSKIWHAHLGENGASSIAYDRGLIEEAAWLIYLEKIQWNAFFHAEKHVPMTLLYEHFEGQISEAARMICRHFDCNDVLSKVGGSSHFQKLGKTYQDYVWRFRKERFVSLNFE